MKFILHRGGSESDNTAIKGIAKAYRNKGNHIITSKIEHPAILESCKSLENEGFKVTYLNVDRNGFISLNELERAIRNDTILISIMFANNEIGTIEPIYEIGKIARKYGIIFHTDAVQAAGTLDIDVNAFGIDALSMSAHKFHGPKGIGVLYLREGIKINNLINGGHQENNKRAGTENVASIVGLAKALTVSKENRFEKNKRIFAMQQYFFAQIIKRFPDVKINGSLEKRLPRKLQCIF